MTQPSSILPRAATDGMRSLLLPGSFTNAWLPWPHHQLIIDMVPERRSAWEKKRARRIAVRHRLHIDTAYELWQARQNAATAPLSRRTLRCFARGETSQQWIDQALQLVPLLREAHLHRSAFELLQWIVGADQLFKSCGCPDNSGFCQTCLLGESPRTEHALRQETCHHWQQREAELLCAAWERRYHFTDALLELQAVDRARCRCSPLSKSAIRWCFRRCSPPCRAPTTRWHCRLGCASGGWCRQKNWRSPPPGCVTSADGAAATEYSSARST